jgi:hypothetical protein
MVVRTVERLRNLLELNFDLYVGIECKNTVAILMGMDAMTSGSWSI